MASLPWIPLAHVPTAVEPCDALAPWLGRGGVWAKRDDAISPIYGGNKVRRYEFVLADAMDRGASRILTVGGIASTQVMATCLFGQHLKIPVRAVLFDQPLTRFAREALTTDATTDADIVHGGGYVRTAWRTWRAAREDRRTYFIPPGAATARANLGYLDAMLELDEQVRAGEMPRPDVIVLPTGSSGTLAALGLGAALLGWPTEVVGVRITLRVACNRVLVNRVIRQTQRKLAALAPSVDWRALQPRYRLFHGAIGPGYGAPTPEAIANIPRVESLLGRPGEVTYSAKALVGLHDIARDPRYANKVILFWHTLSSVRPPADPSRVARLPPSLRRLFDGDVPC